MSKFKAHPSNKKILEVPVLTAQPGTLQPPKFEEFHLKMTERASQHSEKSFSIFQVEDCAYENQNAPHKIRGAALRARPSKVKVSEERELEELENIPKFKANPLSKKILESEGNLKLVSSQKPKVIASQGFHFAKNRSFSTPGKVAELFDKLSLHSDPCYERKQIPRNTIPNPFRLHTEERGIEKQKQFAEQILCEQLEEERCRIPKATIYPYTTDYPVVPPKPQPKQCTKPEPFKLESIVRHEEETRRKLAETQRIEKEQAEKRIFKARSIMRDDPLPERERKPLTEIQNFVLHGDNRAAHRSEFDKKVKEKKMVFKRLMEERETAHMLEEVAAIKRLRRTMVPHARPLPKFYNPFLPQKSKKETTKPSSPDLHIARREERHASCFSSYQQCGRL